MVLSKATGSGSVRTALAEQSGRCLHDGEFFFRDCIGLLRDQSCTEGSITPSRDEFPLSRMAEGVAGECKCCGGGVHPGVTQSLDELDFERSLAGAAQVGDLGRMRGLIARGGKVDGDGESGYSPLHYAARAGHAQACLLLLQSGAHVDRRTRAGKATSLHRAAYAGHIEVVKILLQHGADVVAQDSDGHTSLHKASMQGHSEVLKLLKEACPRACAIVDTQGRSALP